MSVSSRTIALSALLFIVIALHGCQALQRKFLFYPSHDAGDNGFTPWVHIRQAKFHLIPGGHGWALKPGVEVRFP